MTPPTPRLVFHLGAGGAVGFGHLARCRALALAAQARGWRTTFVVETDTPDSITVDIDAPVHLTSDRRDALTRRRTLTRDAGSVVVCDLPDRTAPRDPARTAPLVLLNGDPAEPAPADLVFLRGPASDAQARSSEVHCGFPFEIVRPEIRARRPARPWTRGTVESILVSFGGSDPGGQTEVFLADAAALPPLTVMVGPGFTPDRVTGITALLPRDAALVTTPEAFPDLLAATDCFVTVGGQSVLEALHLGRPVAAVRWGTLAADVSWLAKAGLVADLGPASGAPTALAALLGDPDRLALCARAGWETIDGGGDERCLDAIVARFAAEFRPVTVP